MLKDSIYDQLRVTSYKLRLMVIGQSSVYTETKGYPSGSVSRSLANKSDIKIRTKLCYVTDLNMFDADAPTLIKAVIVTRLT
jgi:hypothetical protein